MKPLARLSVIAGFAAVRSGPSLALGARSTRVSDAALRDARHDDQRCQHQVSAVWNDGRWARTTDASRITVLEPGATIAVQFNETINHAGFYRISFDDDGQDAFVAPSTRAMVQTAPPFTLPVLVNNIADKSGGAYTVMVTLPNVECERCTLQLIQVMVAASVTSWDPGGDQDIYFTCADIALRRAGGGGRDGRNGSDSGSWRSRWCRRQRRCR